MYVLKVSVYIPVRFLMCFGKWLLSCIPTLCPDAAVGGGELEQAEPASSWVCVGGNFSLP